MSFSVCCSPGRVEWASRRQSERGRWIGQVGRSQNECGHWEERHRWGPIPFAGSRHMASGPCNWAEPKWARTKGRAAQLSVNSGRRKLPPAAQSANTARWKPPYGSQAWFHGAPTPLARIRHTTMVLATWRANKRHTLEGARRPPGLARQHRPLEGFSTKPILSVRSEPFMLGRMFRDKKKANDWSIHPSIHLSIHWSAPRRPNHQSKFCNLECCTHVWANATRDQKNSFWRLENQRKFSSKDSKVCSKRSFKAIVLQKVPLNLHFARNVRILHTL